MSDLASKNELTVSDAANNNSKMAFDGMLYTHDNSDDDDDNGNVAIPDDALAKGTIAINVGGTKFKVRASCLTKSSAPRSRLARLVRATTEEEVLRLCDGYMAGETPEFFFNRSWQSFNSILDFYRKGTLHMSTEMCALVFKVK